ncbi:MAG: hypothetical protein II777_10985 [Clostridia bacterium]|nr:hypothetical protein [Clostridia bacterium]
MSTLFSSLFKRLSGLEPEGTDGEGDKAKDNESGVAYFSYSYRGSIGGDSYTRTAAVDGDRVTLTLDMMIKSDYGEMTGEASPGFAAALNELCRKHRIVRWNGFDKYNRHVLDGDGFGLQVRFKDGRTVSADGSNAFPRGYGDFEKDMNELFKAEEGKMLEKRRLELAAEGVSGELKMIMINISRNGGFGDDSYFALLSVGGVRQSNFEVRIKSYSGEFLPEGEYNYCRTVPDEMIMMKDLDDIAKKYDILKWYDYTAYEQGGEYFQISYDYEKGHISAHGSKHPDDYDGFRRETLAKIAKITENVMKYIEENGEDE